MPQLGGVACVKVQRHPRVWDTKGTEGNPCDWVQVARNRVVQDRTLELDRGQGFQDFITPSKERGLNCEDSGETMTDFAQGSNQGRFAF